MLQTLYPILELELSQFDIPSTKAKAVLQAEWVDRLGLRVPGATVFRLKQFLGSHLDKIRTHELCFYPEQETPGRFAFARCQLVALLPKGRHGINQQEALRLHPYVWLRWELRP